MTYSIMAVMYRLAGVRISADVEPPAENQVLSSCLSRLDWGCWEANVWDSGGFGFSCGVIKVGTKPDSQIVALS